MQKGKVYRNKIFAGLLIKISNEEYIFQYDKDYLEKDNAKAISLSFPLQEKEFKSSKIPRYILGKIESYIGTKEKIVDFLTKNDQEVTKELIDYVKYIGQYGWRRD